MGINNNLLALRPEMHIIAEFIIWHAEGCGVKLIVNETLRTQAIQSAYFAQCRNDLPMVNGLRKEAGLWSISEAENKRIVTNVQKISTTQGHGSGLAVDFVPDGKWNSPVEKWAVIGQAVEFAKKEFEKFLTLRNAELIWGGSWVLQGGGSDSPHVELDYK